MAMDVGSKGSCQECWIFRISGVAAIGITAALNEGGCRTVVRTSNFLAMPKFTKETNSKGEYREYPE
jgi:hypothetical protein